MIDQVGGERETADEHECATEAEDGGHGKHLPDCDREIAKINPETRDDTEETTTRHDGPGCEML